MADKKQTPDQILSNEIVGLFERYEMADIGIALVMVFGTYIAKSELDCSNGQVVLDAMMDSFRLLGEQKLDKIIKIKNAAPDELQAFIDKMSHPVH